MRPLRYSINITLDGCIDHTAGFAPDEESYAHSAETIARADALIFGRVMYGLMEAGWRETSESGVSDGRPDYAMAFARAIGGKKKYVVSSRFTPTGWNAEVVRGADLEAFVRRLKAEPGNGLYTAGTTLPRALAEWGLIDEYELVVHPRIEGRGPALFAGLRAPLDLTLVDRREFASGMVVLTYEPKR